VRCRHTSVWCMLHACRRTHLPRPCRRCLWRRPLPHAPTQQWYLLRMNRMRWSALRVLCWSNSFRALTSVSEPIKWSLSDSSVPLPSAEPHCPQATGYSEYSQGVLWVLTQGTRSTHKGYYGYSHRVLWVLTRGTRCPPIPLPSHTAGKLEPCAESKAAVVERRRQ
jgi:hypothetical protein